MTARIISTGYPNPFILKGVRISGEIKTSINENNTTFKLQALAIHVA